MLRNNRLRVRTGVQKGKTMTQIEKAGRKIAEELRKMEEE
jgi:hypothetical protein